jgi:nucleotide-binding universal stress UspA family protein
MNETKAQPEVVAQLVREREIASARDVAHGITFDASRLVVAGGRYLVRVVPASLRLVDELETFPVPGGLAYDGHYLWQRGDRAFQQLDVRTGIQVRAVAPELDGITGLACLEGDLLVLHAGGCSLTRLRVVDHAQSAEAVVVSRSDAAAPLRGLAFAGDTLWSSTAGALVRIDPATARMLQRVALPVGVVVSDVAADGEGRLWCVDGSSRTLRVFAAPIRAGERALAGPGPAASMRVADVSTAGAAARVTDGETAAGRAGATAIAVESPAALAGATFARILVPLDFSAVSKRALATALVLQDRLGAEVHLFHHAESGENSEFLAGVGAGAVPSERLADDGRERIRRFVDNLFPGRGAGVTVHAHVGVDVVQGVLHAVEESRATLVLLAGRPHRSLLRTDIEKLVRDLTTPVMVLWTEEDGAAA